MGNIFTLTEEIKKIRNELQKRDQIMENELIKLKKTNIEFQKKFNEINELITKIKNTFN
jgi:hypothetical protein